MALTSLTTVFGPVASCISNIYLFENASYTCVGGTRTVPCAEFHLGPTTSSSACLPTGWDPGEEAFFSPGVCPSGYTTACSNVVTIGDVTETRATCCPSSFLCQTRSNLPFYSTEVCSFDNPVWQTFVYTSSVFGGGMITSTKTGNGINAYGIKIRWQSSDFAPATSTSASTSGSASAPAPTGTSATGIAVSPAKNNSSAQTQTAQGVSRSLSTGAIAGIAVGAVLGALCVLSGGALLVWRRRKQTRAGHDPGVEHKWHEAGGPSPVKTELYVQPPELAGHEDSKAQAQPQAQTKPVELDGTGWTGK